MNVSINPWYLCNMRCSFCYLTHDQLSDDTLMDLDDLDIRLSEIDDHSEINQIDLYGGEVGLLPEDYVDDMFTVIRKYSDVAINVISNFTVMHPMFYRDDVTVSVSYDFECRKTHKVVLMNILMFTGDVSILVLASPELLKREVITLASTFNAITNVKSVEIKPYSTNQSNALEVQNHQYENFIKDWIMLSDIRPFNFLFINEQRIIESLDGAYSAWSDDHVYIVPSGDYAVLEFDSNNNEYFKEYCTFDQYIIWANAEKDKIESNPVCGTCKYMGKCLTEHYRNEVSNESCNGFYKLIEWYGNGRMESSTRNIS